MKLSLFTTTCTAFAAVVASSVGADESTQWTYATGDKHRVGPTQWGKVFPTCAGKRQSPIDISVAGDATGGLPLQLSGSCSEYNVTQQYDAFKAQILGGSCAVDYFGKVFRFKQVHFHAPSEHTIDGDAFDAEAHFVHQATDGQVVVLGVFLQRDDDKEYGSEDVKSPPYFTNLLASLDHVDEQTPVTTMLGSFHAAVSDLFDAGRVFNYPGGLTVPPCSEVVNWWVLETPLRLSTDDYETVIASLQRIEAVDEDGENARPTQPLHGRKIQVY